MHIACSAVAHAHAFKTPVGYGFVMKLSPLEIQATWKEFVRWTVDDEC